MGDLHAFPMLDLEFNKEKRIDGNINFRIDSVGEFDRARPSKLT
jgi:hypothetical protein